MMVTKLLWVDNNSNYGEYIGILNWWSLQSNNHSFNNNAYTLTLKNEALN